VKLLDASFIWTEPHSRRIKIKLTVEKEIMHNVWAQQSFPVEFVVMYQQCEECKKECCDSDTWGALVQIRQKVDHKKTFLLLEQLVLKYNAHDKVLSVKDLPEGVDFFYKEKSHAQRLVDFLQTMLPIRVKHSKQQVISQDPNSNHRYIFSVDLPKICKDDLVFLPPRISEALGGCSQVLVCTKVSTMVVFIDPVTMRTIEISGADYFKYEDDLSVVPFKGYATEFLVFNTEPWGTLTSGNKVKNIMIGRVGDWKNFNVKTYLGDAVKEGSYVMGYDMTSLNLSDNSILKGLPEVILVKKIAKNTKRRIWKLKQLEKEGSENRTQEDYEEFLDDLEADPEMRSHVNMYRNEKTINEKKSNQMVDETDDKENPNKSLKKKLKVKRNSKNGNVLAATGGQDNNNNNDENGDGDQDENRDNNGKRQEKKKEEVEEKNEDDAMVRIEELLADLTLEDQIVEDNDDAIDEFISRLENIRIEGKE